MRKLHQKTIFELLETLNEAHDVLSKQTAPEIVGNLLADCQKFAVQIGQYIENIEGEGTQTVALLEEYCELLYRASIDNNDREIVKELKQQLVKIKNSVESELKRNKIEVVFFPYQLSMFDALESVYLAAKEDPQCDVYCVPIPYFSRNPDGSVKEVHYDGGLYPDYVEVTNWRDYDVASRRPDVIFIHNPYDVTNIVTSVHPDYYSEKLCKLTELLVYIPYFVTEKVQEHFCFNSGTIYAHKTIVPNDLEQKRYINFFKKNEVAHNLSGKIGDSKKKFVALGSPKFDKVIQMKREDYGLTDEWRDLIEDANGTRKKVVFYNTSIAEILQFGEQFLKKLRSVLDVFKHRDDFVLWWRPHPLSMATFDSMRLGMADEYREIIKEYRREASGIYDDTTDLYRAIAWSDAYYGWGGSSVALLYGATLKPVMALHTCDNVSVAEGEGDFNEKLLHFTKCLDMYLSGSPVYRDMPLYGFFFDDANQYDLWSFLQYITHIEDYENTVEWNSLLKTAYKRFGVSANERSGDKIIQYVKEELKL